MRGKVLIALAMVLCLTLLAGCFTAAGQDPSGENLQALVGKPLHIPEAEKQGGLYYKLSAGALWYWLSTPEKNFTYPDTQPEDLIYRVNYTKALVELGIYDRLNLFDYEDKTLSGEFMVYKVPKEVFTPLVELFFDGININEDYLVREGYMDTQKTAYILSGAGGYGGVANFTIKTLERLKDGDLFVQVWSEAEIEGYPSMQLSFVVDDSGELLRFVKADLEYVYDAAE